MSLSSSVTAECNRQLVQISSAPLLPLSREPHCAQTDCAAFIQHSGFRSRGVCQNVAQIAQLFVDFVWCRDRASNLTPNDFSIPLTQPMNVRLYSCARKAGARGHFIVRWNNAPTGEKCFQLF